ncbi:PREDICTED: uncharacterized protein LOC109310776 [Crocodylus porosus]|uniref:uncharacterized protein LOC109310776 n=1 Tax=Crocodylus porosus TaxID=8502 RepID=UPI00093B8E59|nr:PREDICTED: uncharacterized protein LOC109310776 [Crocodylus porosus]
MLPLALFVLRDAPSEPLGYSPFELVLGHQPHGLLQILLERWEQGPTVITNPSGYRQAFQQRVQNARELAAGNLRQAQQHQKERYDMHAKDREFQPGQKLFVLLPTLHSKLLTQWQGPFEVTWRVGPVDYEVYHPGHKRTKQIYHINLLREWHQPEGWVAFRAEGTNNLRQREPDVETLIPESVKDVRMGIELTLAQEKEAWELLIEFKEVFSENPGRTDASSTAIGAVLTQRDTDLDQLVAYSSRKLLPAKIRCGEDAGPDRDGSLHRIAQQVTGTAEGDLEKPPQGSWWEGLCPRVRGMKEDLPATQESACEGQKAEPMQLISRLFIKLWQASDISAERWPAWIKMAVHAAELAGKERTQPRRSPQPRQAEARNQKSRSG